MLAIPREIDWRIHQVAYVENLKPLRQSNFVTACIRPRFPSWIRSRREAGRLVALGDRHHESQVRLHEGALGLTAGTDLAPERAAGGRGRLLERLELSALLLCPSRCSSREPLLIVFREQRVAADVGQVDANEILIIAAGARAAYCTMV